jgi:hypothetical protein
MKTLKTSVSNTLLRQIGQDCTRARIRRPAPARFRRLCLKGNRLLCSIGQINARQRFNR